jgi:porin
MKWPIALSVIPIVGLVVTLPLAAAETPAAPPATADAAAQAQAPQGLLPLPDYSGDLADRSHLTGDWGGTRTEWAAHGVQAEVDFTQIVQSVVEGGRGSTTRYGGSLDYLVNLDLMRMGVLPGALLTVRAETRFGDSANVASGSLLPVSTEALFPLSGELDESIGISLTTLRYTQFLAPEFGVFVGKFDTLESTNEFAAGRGVSQFLNGNFVFSPSGALLVPYSTLGTGIILLPIKDLTITSMIFNTNDSSTSSGFDEFGNGWTWLTAANYQYKLGDLPGGQGLAVGYGRDNEFKQVAGGLLFERGHGLSPVTQDDSWFACWDTWQYLWTKDAPTESINLSNGRQDLAGIGFFTRMSFADKDTNPVEYALSGGIAARGLIPSRNNDSLGVAYAYNRIQRSRLIGFANLEKQTQAFEAYYDIAVTPAAHLTLDVQLVDAAETGIDSSVVLGARCSLKF